MTQKGKSASPVSNLDVLDAISDNLCVDILTAIFNGVTNSDVLMEILAISHKEYYSKSYRLARLGLISRKNGEIILTSFGRVVYNAQLKIANAFSYLSELMTVDTIKSNSQIPEDEQKKIIDSIIHDTELKKSIATS